jgi:putative hydrolase of HD superfamily
MLHDDITRLRDFASSLEGLKKLVRYQGQHFWEDYPAPKRYESVADHSWRLAMFVLTLKDHLSQPIDIEKALQMALVHDLPEIVAGDESPLGKDGTGKDTHAFDQTKADERHDREASAAKHLFGVLPKAQAQKLFHVWEEYEAQICFEAKVVLALDKIEALLQVLEYRQGHMFPEHLEFSTKYALKYADVDPAIRAFAESIVKEMRIMFKPFTGGSENER